MERTSPVESLVCLGETKYIDSTVIFISQLAPPSQNVWHRDQHSRGISPAVVAPFAGTFSTLSQSVLVN
ncbi:hypothetical protein M404DRAFT_1007172 [Pisolithus tinctorius Marx 270]|uniref:Uncharacterized protein n=1 Tax=Pisolithus tinctorius Marx 270 TaxID=870435 RepID=A0A0C3N410_PISTI|nr:hypothetical protein M404DRAFT_1007172 [Pisolithus tinctorius Marx 270]